MATYQRGDRVTIQGLVKAAKYNGEPATVTGDPTDGRYPVHLINVLKDLRVKPGNLRPRSAPGSAEPSVQPPGEASPPPTARKEEEDAKTQDAGDEKTGSDGDPRSSAMPVSFPPSPTLPVPDSITVSGAGCSEANSEYRRQRDRAGRPSYSGDNEWTLAWSELDGGTWWLCDRFIGRYAAMSNCNVPPPKGWESCSHICVNPNGNYRLEGSAALPAVGPDPPTLAYKHSDKAPAASRRPSQIRVGKPTPKSRRANSVNGSGRPTKKPRGDSGAPGVRGAKASSSAKPAAKGKKRIKLEKRLRNLLDREGYDVSRFDSEYGPLSNKGLDELLTKGKNGDFSFVKSNRRAD